MDDRYERSADMRLLDFERARRGVPPRVIGSTYYADPDNLAELEGDATETYVSGGTILVAAMDAQPRAALIPGALVTISLSIVNEGDTAASSARITLPLPAETAYRNGTITVDGSAASDALAGDLFANGAELGDIPPGARRTLCVKLVIEAGIGDVRLSPHLTASSGAVLGLRAMRLTRKAAGSRTAVVEQPFYESDAAEHAAEPLAPAPTLPTISVLQPRELPVLLPVAEALPAVALASAATPAISGVAPAKAPPVVVPAKAPPVVVPAKAPPVVVPAKAPPAVAPAKAPPAEAQAKAPPPATTLPSTLAPLRAAKASVAVRLPSVPKAVTKRVSEPKPKPIPKPRAKAKPKAATAVPLVIRPKIEVVRSVDDRLSLAAQGGPILSVRMDRKRLATLTGLFSGASFGMIAHYLVLNALAVKDALPGDAADGAIAEFVGEQERLLSRALITTRLGRTPAPDSVSARLPVFPTALTTYAEYRAVDMPPPGETLLIRAFAPSETAFLQRTLSNDKAAPFMRAAQLFVGLCANDAVVADDSQRRSLAVALSAYAVLATAEISRIFLHAKPAREPDLFKATDPVFDAAARTVLAILGRSVA